MRKAIVVVMAALAIGVVMSSGFLWTLDHRGHQVVSEMDILKIKNEETRGGYQPNFQALITNENGSAQQ